MALLTSMPQQSVIDSMHGVLDFYKWCNLNIVRKWPRAPQGPRSPAVQVRANRFAAVGTWAQSVPPNIRAAYEEMAEDGAFSWKDWLTRQYINSTKDLHEYKV